VLLSFSDPPPKQWLLLQHLSSGEWQKLLNWLDVSGLALYFLNRLVQLDVCDMLPPAVIERLQQNMMDNAGRTHGMIAESVSIQSEFQKAGLSYAILKGLSLCPNSVQRPELRHQFDLDFLVAERDAPTARQILEHRGYRLYAISGRSWEFKINESPGVSMKDFYKDLPGRAVELHLEADRSDAPSVLERIEKHELFGIAMPVLSPVALFLRQGLHAYKDICSEFSRASHLLEFRRHVLALHDDDAFWRELQSAAEGSLGASLRLGVVTHLIEYVMGAFAPEAFTSWTVRRLSPSVRLWVEIYGHRAVFKTVPGNKLYLLLQKELEAEGVPAKRSIKKALFPSRLPPAVIRASASETSSAQISRYWLQLHFIFSRLRFHVVEGFRYTWESYRWRQHTKRFTR
jgi:hypothetical protein